MLKSKVSLEAYQENDRTFLGESFHSAPYKMVHYGDKNLHDHLEMIMMSSSPGMMAGDELEIQVKAKENARLRVYTQSFNKLHPMKDTGAYQHTQVSLKAGSLLHYIPHPITPFANSIFKTVNEIEMAPDATLIWGDIIASGRVAHHESFQFKRLHSITKIKVGGKVALYDNQLLQPDVQPIKDLLYYEGYTHQATLICISPFGDQLKEELDEILVGDHEEISYGFTSCGPGMVMLRALSNDGELLYDWISTIGRLCWDFTVHCKDEELKASETIQDSRRVESSKSTSAELKQGLSEPKVKKRKRAVVAN